jgi:uncharacterized protein (TIGR02466 family)
MEYSIMVDVNLKIDEYAAFPTMIYKFESDLFDEHLKMIEYIKNQPMTMEGMIQTKDNLFKLEEFKSLVEIVQNITANILKNLKYDGYKNIEITSMWGNHMNEGRAHPPHTHSNNFLSGVYYIESSKDSSPIQFFDPKPQANILKPAGAATWQNSSMLQFESIVGTGLIFPSWLQHWVPPTSSERTSISWNCILRGDYGSREEYQYAYF